MGAVYTVSSVFLTPFAVLGSLDFGNDISPFMPLKALNHSLISKYRLNSFVQPLDREPSPTRRAYGTYIDRQDHGICTARSIPARDSGDPGVFCKTYKLVETPKMMALPPASETQSPQS